jgi:hypothetical protein
MPALGPHLLASYSRLVEHLASKERVLLLTTSNRYREHVWDVPKTTQLARRIEQRLLRGRTRATLLDVAALQIHACEGNISGSRGNNCGVHAAKLLDKRKNPTGHHRCWASINNRDDELYKVSRELFRSQAVVFFVSVRWGPGARNRSRRGRSKRTKRLPWRRYTAGTGRSKTDPLLLVPVARFDYLADGERYTTRTGDTSPRGRRITNVVVPAAECASSVPPCESTIWRAM